MKQIFQPYFGVILDPICPNLRKMNFPERAMSAFKNSNYLPLCKNSEKH